jgi:tRNA (cytidine/uridine-2'-O-)-methyltransferase
MSLHIVLYQPEIPANSGNIARLSVAAACELHLIRPLGYVLSDRYLKRAGLDYWPHVKLNIYDGLDQLIEKYPGSRFFYFSTKAGRPYTEVHYKDGDFLVFGPESRGLPDEILAKNEGNALTIPMFGPVRSINLSTAVGVVVYEALRQLRGF